MIASLRGTLISKNPTEVVVDVGGVGYGVHIPLSTFEKLGNPGSEVSLHTYLHVREDAMLLYGFSSEEERSLFKLLLSVTGIGPRMAQGILSGIPVSDLRAYLQTGNTAALTTIPGYRAETRRTPGSGAPGQSLENGLPRWFSSDLLRPAGKRA